MQLAHLTNASEPPIPFVPLRWTLYDWHELFDGFTPDDPHSFAATGDFAIYRHFVAGGGSAPASQFTSMMQALHDNCIARAANGLVRGHKVAAIMGGHKMPRDHEQYAEVARLARQLTRAGILLCTGGGPGAMEATHLGAALANSPDDALDAAIAGLSKAPAVPAMGGIVNEHGQVNDAMVAEGHAWFEPAFTINASIADRGLSLAIPTWHYGHEPTTPFATHIAKYFQNSIREDGLLALATQGIIFAEGRAGTIQEIFQDAAQNYYETFKYFSPMVLLGTQTWTGKYPVVAVLEHLFGPERFARYVRITDDVDEAAAFIIEFTPELPHASPP